MYILTGHIGRRGFSLEKAGQTIFKTAHSFGFLPNSSVKLGNDTIKIKLKDLLGMKSSIIKNGHNIGNIDFTSYRYSTVALGTKEGSTDIFKLEAQGFSQIYILSKSNSEILKFEASLNPLRIDDRFKIEILSDAYHPKVLEELIYYAGEVLYRLVRSTKSI